MEQLQSQGESQPRASLHSPSSGGAQRAEDRVRKSVTGSVGTAALACSQCCGHTVATVRSFSKL